MARTKAVARIRSGGKAPNKLMSGKPSLSFPYSNAGWTSVKCGRRHIAWPSNAMCNSEPSFANHFTIPSHAAISKITTPLRGRRAHRLRVIESKQFTSNIDTTLPTEILTQIFELVISTGGVYHFTKIEKQRDGRPGMSIFKARPYIEYDEGQKLEAPTTLALACRRFKDISYSIFYGRNDFVLELGSRPLMSCIAMLDDSRPHLHWLGLTRVMHFSASSSPWPLSAGNSRCIIDLTVVLAFSSQFPMAEERLYLQQQTRTLADLLTGYGERPALKRLAIDVSVAYAWPGKFASKRLSLVRIPWNGPESSRMRMSLKELPKPPPRSRGQAAAKKIADPLLKLLESSQMSLSGLLQ